MSKSNMAVGIGATVLVVAVIVLLVVRNSETPPSAGGIGPMNEVVSGNSPGDQGESTNLSLTSPTGESARVAVVPGSYASRGSSFWGSSYRGSSYAGAGYRTSSFSGLPSRSSNGLPIGDGSPSISGWAHGSAGGRGASYAGSAARRPNYGGSAYGGSTYRGPNYGASSFGGSAIRRSGSGMSFQGSASGNYQGLDNLERRTDEMERRVEALIETIRRKKG